MARARITGPIATQELIDKLKGNLRKEDNDECLAAGGITADVALQKGFMASKWCRVLLKGGKPFCAFGVAPLHKTLLPTVGVPWLLGTDEVKNNARAMVVLGKFYARIMLEDYSFLENYVDARNLTAIRWLKHCGFTIEEPVEYGVEGRPFHHFYMSGV